MKITCSVNTVIYHNEQNGYTVMVVDINDGTITAVGTTSFIKVGATLELEGEFASHKVYGKQFVFTKYEEVLPQDESGIISYLASGEIKGVGQKLAERIVKEFGKDTIDKIRFEPIALTTVKAINEEKALNISDYFNEQWEKWNLTSFLKDFGVPIKIVSKIYKVYGSTAIDKIKEDPYDVLNKIKGVEFELIDKVGKKLNIPFDDEKRIMYGIIDTISKTMLFGHTCVLKETLIENASVKLAIAEETVENIIIKMKTLQLIYTEKIEDKEYIFSSFLYTAESNIAKKIIELTIKKTKNKNYEKAIERLGERLNIVLSEEQKSAVSTCLNNNISIITGGPGTGKTTIIKCIIDILTSENKKFVLCAPTGRAAKRMSQTTGVEAKTLHRLLEIAKVEDDDIEKLISYNVKKIETDVVIVDEVSMIDVVLMNNFMKAISENTKVVFVGDVDQLPSVGPGNVLSDLIESNVVNVLKLSHVYRQSEKSDIIANAHRVNMGMLPEFKQGLPTDMYFLKTSSIEETIDETVKLLEYGLNDFSQFDNIKNVQVITPMRKSDIGANNLNKIIKEVINKDLGQIKKEVGSRHFKIGDKVMQTSNNYDIYWNIGSFEGQGVYNGDIGYITDIDKVNETLTVTFEDDRIANYEFDELEQLEHAYCITVHKSQGNEFDIVLMPLYSGIPKLFTRNLLYTAMTRAKKLLIIIGNEKLINYMVGNIGEKSRKTGLKTQMIKLMK